MNRKDPTSFARRIKTIANKTAALLSVEEIRDLYAAADTILDAHYFRLAASDNADWFVCLVDELAKILECDKKPVDVIEATKTLKRTAASVDNWKESAVSWTKQCYGLITEKKSLEKELEVSKAYCLDLVHKRDVESIDLSKAINQLRELENKHHDFVVWSERVMQKNCDLTEQLDQTQEENKRLKECLFQAQEAAKALATKNTEQEKQLNLELDSADTQAYESRDLWKQNSELLEKIDEWRDAMIQTVGWDESTGGDGEAVRLLEHVLWKEKK